MAHGLFREILEALACGKRLAPLQVEEAFKQMMTGHVSDPEIAAFLMALRVRGETVEEIIAAAQTMRAEMIEVKAPEGALDIVGTGGDGSFTYNISTCAAFIAAGAGGVVAKHGNRAISSRSGAADTLEALGVRLDLSPDTLSRCLSEVGLAFMFAPNHHLGVKHVGSVRRALGIRTIFNLLGPLCNPARVKYQVLGVYDPLLCELLAHALSGIGVVCAWIVCGEHGEDEILSSGKTKVVQLQSGKVTSFFVHPEEVGLAVAPREDLRGAGAHENAEALRAVLSGKRSAFYDSACMTAGAALYVAGHAKNYLEGVLLAQDSVESGRALSVLERLVIFSKTHQ